MCREGVEGNNEADKVIRFIDFEKNAIELEIKEKLLLCNKPWEESIVEIRLRSSRLKDCMGSKEKNLVSLSSCPVGEEDEDIRIELKGAEGGSLGY